jgi:DNA-binding HxlR family transcriptional regulator
VLGYTWCKPLAAGSALSDELRSLVEARMERTLEAIEDTLRRILEKREIRFEDLREVITGLEKSFSLLSQKWNLEILYTLFLRNSMGFGALKRILGVNSRTLSDKLKVLDRHGYVQRTVEHGPPLRVTYSLTARGRNTVLLALPLLYYSSG